MILSDTVRILFIGDIVGSPGRNVLKEQLADLREELILDFVIANCENAAAGLGITERLAKQLLGYGIDALTTGNHTYKRRDVYDFLDSEPRIVRPANYLPSSPGRGWTVIESGGIKYCVANLMGNFVLNAPGPAFTVIDSVLDEIEGKADVVLLDFHAEATSEKVAMGWYLDGKVAAVVGTHTHIPTTDARVLPGGTAYITDVGMTGARESVIGVKKELAIQRFRTQLPVKFETADQDVWINAVLIEADRDSGKALKIEQVLRPAS